MQPDSERFILLQDTQIYAAGLMVWHLLLNSTSSWIHMKRTFFFSSAAGAVTASRGLYGKAMDSFSFTKGPLQKAGTWRFQLASYKRRGTGDHAGTISGVDEGAGDRLQTSDPGSVSSGSPVKHCAKRRKSKIFSYSLSRTEWKLSTAEPYCIHSIMEYSPEELNSFSKETLVAVILSMQDQLSQLNANMERLIEQISDAYNKRYGRSSEKLDVIAGQLELELIFNEAEALTETLYVVEPAEEDVIQVSRRKRKGKREEDLKDLPIEVIPHTLSDEKLQELFGPDGWKRLPDEVYKRVRVQPAVYTVEEHHVAVYAGRDNQTIVKADRPRDLLRNSIRTPSLAASIMNPKYVNGLPLYRISQEFLRNDIHISKQVMANWMIQCADRYLGILYDYLHKELYRFHVLQADETPVMVSKDGRPANSKSYMWIYRTGKIYKDTPIVLYEYQRTRKADHPREFLKGFTGVVVCDGYSAYRKLDRENPDITFAGCWTHYPRSIIIPEEMQISA